MKFFKNNPNASQIGTCSLGKISSDSDIYWSKKCFISDNLSRD